MPVRPSTADNTEPPRVRLLESLLLEKQKTKRGTGVDKGFPKNEGPGL